MLKYKLINVYENDMTTKKVSTSNMPYDSVVGTIILAQEAPTIGYPFLFNNVRTSVVQYVTTLDDGVIQVRTRNTVYLLQPIKELR